MTTLVRVAEYGLAALFLYLGTAKLLGPGASTLGRILMAAGELIVGGLILLRTSELLSTPAVIVVAAAEVALFSRPPLAAIACVSAHGLTTWGRIALGAKIRNDSPVHDHRAFPER